MWRDNDEWNVFFMGQEGGVYQKTVKLLGKETDAGR